MRIVLDTNVLIAGLLSPSGPPARILDLVLAGDVTLLFDDRILAEYRAVTRRPRFGFDERDVIRVLDAIVAEGEFVSASPMALTLPDQGDLPFLEVAATGRAEALVTGNVRHFRAPRGSHAVRVLTPRALIETLETGD